MWLLVQGVMNDLTSGSWITRLLSTALLASFLLCAGWFGGYGIATMTGNSNPIDRPIAVSGNALASSTTRLSAIRGDSNDSRNALPILKQGSAPLNERGGKHQSTGGDHDVESH